MARAATLNSGGGYLSPKIELRLDSCGIGAVVAKELIEKDEVVVAWAGYVATWAQLEKMSDEQKSHTLQIDEDLFQYPITTPSSDPPDFINHSCNPNCGIRGQIVMVAMRQISPGEEVTYDYAMSDGSAYDEFPCSCGSPKCRGKVSGNDWKIEELWPRYEGYYSTYLERRISKLRKARV